MRALTSLPGLAPGIRVFEAFGRQEKSWWVGLRTPFGSDAPNGATGDGHKLGRGWGNDCCKGEIHEHTIVAALCAVSDACRRNVGGFAGARRSRAAEGRRGRHRLDDRGHRARADDDHPGAGAVLLRHGAQEERARHHGAEPAVRGAVLGAVGGRRLLAGVQRRRRDHRQSREGLPVEHRLRRRRAEHQASPKCCS